MVAWSIGAPTFCSAPAEEKQNPIGENVTMQRTSVILFVVFAFAPDIAVAANGKCTSIQAQCAVEMGGQCDPQTGHWCYGFYRSHQCGGTNNGMRGAQIARTQVKTPLPIPQR